MSKKMGIYCKAYQLKQLRAYPNWRENGAAARSAGDDPKSGARVLDGEDVVYVQEDLSVTDGIFLDEHVIFSDDRADWSEYCRNVLHFVIPEDVLRASRLAAA